MINQEIKGNLAKLLATENLIVEHRNVPTASFDTNRRVLTLPIWNKASATVYDMLVGHEVGHALYTPDTDWSTIVRNNVPKDFVNVVEDSRIEKLMKRKFPGLSRSFYQGYQELNEDDFFEILDVDMKRLSFIDRINLHFKVGAFAMIPFVNNIEDQFIVRIGDAETFEEVLAICEDIVDYLKEQQQEHPTAPSQQPQEGQIGVDDDNPISEDKEDTDASEDECKDQSNDSTQLDTPSCGGSIPNINEQVSQTQRSFDESTEELSSDQSLYNDIDYVEIPKIKLENTIVDCKALNDYIAKFWSNQGAERLKLWGDIFEVVDTQYKNYKLSAQKEVNYLVKEFECKKSADAYARTSTARSGVLDTSKLHTYKYSDDIFKKINVVPDGKNHGLIFILDWSGSMVEALMDTVKQLLNLCWFCKKVQIPFEVYAFTLEWNPFIIDDEMVASELPPKCDIKIGEFNIHRRFFLLNFLSSRSNAKEFDTQAKHLFRMAYAYRNYVLYSSPNGCGLSGTPLNESIIALHQIIPQFKNNNKLQKVNVVILTDGEGCDLTYNTENSYMPNGIGSRRVSGCSSLRDRKTGNVYRTFQDYCGSYDNSLTAILLENLQHRFPEINLIGFRIVTGSEFNRVYRYINSHSGGYDIPDQIIKQWRKSKSIEMNPIGYDALYILGSSVLSTDTTFDVADDASIAQVRRAFRTTLKKKSTNKKLLSSFASLVS
jgi:hypothetical protein